MSPELTRDQISYLEAKDPDADWTPDEEKNWVAVVEASKPRGGRMVYEDGIPMGVDNEAEWDRWHATPIADILFARVPTIHVPARLEARPRGRRPRGSRRARSPGRPEDDDPDLDLSALRVISPEAFARVLQAAGL